MEQVTAQPYSKPSAVGMVILGFVAGMASALLGIGAGALVVPTLSGLMGFALKRAVGISLGAMVGIVGVGLVTEMVVAFDNIRWDLGFALILGAQLGVSLGGCVIQFMPEKVLRYLLFVLLIVIAARMLGFVGTNDIEGRFADDGLVSVLGLAILGVAEFAGFLSVMFGLGGGVVVVPALVFLVGGMIFHSARATSLFMILPTAVTGALLHIRQKNAVWEDIWPVMIPGGAGAIVGVILANSLAAPQLHKLFAVFVVFAAARLLGKRSSSYEPSDSGRWVTGKGDGI